MQCFCCGSTDFNQKTILWKELTDEWRLAPQEIAYMNRQQGLTCAVCETNLRSNVLALAIMRCFGYSGLFKNFVISPVAQPLKVLELNNAGHISALMGKLPGNVQKSFPEVDMMDMRFKDGSFDLVVHADDLEHVKNPVRGLSECNRILKPGGFCVFTTPVIVGRITSSREGLGGSFHGPRNQDQFKVWTEFGSDVWEYVVKAGFSECRIVSLEYPAGLAYVGVKA